MEADIKKTFESYDEIEVISETKEIPQDEVSDSAASSSDSLCSRRTPSVTVVRPEDSPSLSPQDQESPSLPPISPLFKMFETDVCGTPAKGPRYKLITEGDLQVCCLNHTRTVISKILSSKFLRRWESHRLYLNDSCISSKTPMGFLDMSIPYSALQEVYVVKRWDTNHKFCIRLVVPNGSVLLQASNAYIRDQWFNSISWKKDIFKYQNLLTCSTRPEVILKELKNLVELATTTPLHDECVYQVPIDIVSRLLIEEDQCWSGRLFSEELITTLAPLLENCPPSPEMCRLFSHHCMTHPRSPLISDALTPIVHRILKHNVDFGKYPLMKKLVQDYIQALHSHNDNEDILNKFVSSVHGPSSGCPHPRVLPNLVSVCLSAIFNIFEVSSIMEERNIDQLQDDRADRIDCYLQVFREISEYDDWRPGLAQLLQPVPVPDLALANNHFIKNLTPVIQRIGTSSDCEVHQMVLGVREGKEGWFDIFCPNSAACIDDGQLWGKMLETLLACCHRRKRFVTPLIAKSQGPLLLLSLRECAAAHTTLCLALEWDLLGESDQRLTVVTTLQSTPSGAAAYQDLCNRQRHLQELQQRGGPRKLTLPSRSTDSDVIRLLSCGALGNLECLSLAFTHVTSACAEHIIKLPSLRYLNLWATQFGDAGLLTISEHLPKLQVLNLCETSVTDKGISALTAMTNLRKLNLNSTKLSAHTFEELKQKLPLLQELDVRYTEAW
ncbi:C-Maf-inducing protein-like [Macrosteles quadrilineatus]|uniref:C-Maf-inducing protein-like n=1 Tax=Macrosteles quadrilineatus TaxID=74068 RepID=UPI0023E220DD|nr:C-Maf-inducing protein-like [Macrosteles quadrilineatus]